MKGGVRKKSCAQSDDNLKIIPIIENADDKGSSILLFMTLEERRLSVDVLNFQNSTPNDSNIWRQDIKFKSSEKSDLAGPNGETMRSHFFLNF